MQPIMSGDYSGSNPNHRLREALGAILTPMPANAIGERVTWQSPT